MLSPLYGSLGPLYLPHRFAAAPPAYPVVKTIMYFPANPTYEMSDGTFAGSNNGVDYTTLFQNTVTPPYDWVTLDVSSNQATYRYLRFQGSRMGELRFLDAGGALITGTPFGGCPSYYGSHNFTAAFDGDTGSPYTRADQGRAGSYVALDLETAVAAYPIVKSIGWTPVTGQEIQMNGGIFDASHDGIHYINIYNVLQNSALPNYQPTSTFNFANFISYRYIRFTPAAGSRLTVAEINFYDGTGSRIGGAPFGSTGCASAFDGNTATFIDVTSGFVSLDFGG